MKRFVSYPHLSGVSVEPIENISLLMSNEVLDCLGMLLLLEDDGN
jgi:hypothetical protein